MKKLIAGLMALAAVATVAQAEGVYSKNAVGFINKEVAAGELVALTIPFNNMDSEIGAWAFTNTQIAVDAPRGSTVYFWENSSWKAVNKVRAFSTDHVLQPGEFFFFKPASDMTVTMAGEVPDDETMTVDVIGEANLSAIGYAYPASIAFTNTTLATAAERGSTVYFWENGSWKAVNKVRAFSTDHALEPGEGFFFKTPAGGKSIAWDETKPYEFP